jgi:hypothetical protein
MRLNHLALSGLHAATAFGQTPAPSYPSAGATTTRIPLPNDTVTVEIIKTTYTSFVGPDSTLGVVTLFLPAQTVVAESDVGLYKTYHNATGGFPVSSGSAAATVSASMTAKATATSGQMPTNATCLPIVLAVTLGVTIALALG